MKRRHLERTHPRSSKRQFHISSHKAFNQNQQLQNFSCTSLNSYLKEYHLSKKDLVELRQALQKIAEYFQSKKTCQNQQRLTSPYLRQRRKKSIVDHSSFLPLYTNEYFIRNGLLNHNDGPEIFSSMNVSSPLSLLPNQKHLFTALTSNFASNQPKCSQSNLGLIRAKYQTDRVGEEIETDSMIIRRNKVQTWERENILQRQMSVDCSLNQSSLIQTLPSNNDRIQENLSPVSTANQRETNADQLFPMVKKLAPYIIIRQSIDRETKEKKSIRLSHDVLHSTLRTNRGRSLLLPSSSTMQQTNNEDRKHSRKKNYLLLAEFDSVLTPIST